MFEELGFDLLVKDKKTGKMKKSVESKFIELQASKSSIVPLYLEYSAAFKVVTSFGQNFLDAINPVTQRIHPTFNQMMDTGKRLLSYFITNYLVNPNIFFLIFAA